MPAPVITSTLTSSGAVGTVFGGYTITASNTPTSYHATGLPTGLSVNTSTGAITGTPTGGGSFNVLISATNGSGTGSATLVMTIAFTHVYMVNPFSSTGSVILNVSQLEDLGAPDTHWGGVAIRGEDMYLSDNVNHCVYKGKIGGSFEVYCGLSGTSGLVDGLPGAARFNKPGSMCLDGRGCLWILDQGNAKIRHVDGNGQVSTICSVPALSGGEIPGQICVDDSGRVFMTSNA